MKQYQILIDTRLLHQYNVTLRQVEDAINRSNANVGGDLLTMGSQSHNVRALGLLGDGIDPLDPANVENGYRIEADKLDDIQNVVITSTNGEPIYVRQVAKVEIGHRPQAGQGGTDAQGEGRATDLARRGRCRGRHRPDAEVREVAARGQCGRREAARDRAAATCCPRGMSLRVFNQRADLVHVTTQNVLHNLVVGMALVAAVLFVFLGDLISAAIVALVIPLALLFSVTRALTCRGNRPTCCPSARSISGSSSTAR